MSTTASPVDSAPVEDRLRRRMAGLTPTERKLAEHLQVHYPVVALGSITALAQAAGVSTPTVVRLVHKLGFRGYPDFQATVRAEVEEMLASPLTKRDRGGAAAADGHVLARFAAQAAANLTATAAAIPPEDFDAVARLLAGPQRILTIGGRLTGPVATYFATLLRMVRPAVDQLAATPDDWLPALLDLTAEDCLLVFDIRRYETTVVRLAELAAEQGATVVLITDRWGSPVARHARHVLPCHVAAPSAWDSTAALLVLVEALVAAVHELRWGGAETRLRRLEDLLTRAQLFHRPR